MHIWLICGYAGSGKTTLGTMLHTYLPSAETTAFAKKVKDDVAKKYNISRELCESQKGKATILCEGKTVRDFLIEYSAQHKLDTHNPEIWAHYVVQEIMEKPTIEHWILHDWRYHAELACIQRIPNSQIHTIRILNPVIQASSSPSEHELDDVCVKYIINNTGSISDLEYTLKNSILKEYI